MIESASHYEGMVVCLVGNTAWSTQIFVWRAADLLAVRPTVPHPAYRLYLNLVVPLLRVFLVQSTTTRPNNASPWAKELLGETSCL